jgi:hypothetical protein
MLRFRHSVRRWRVLAGCKAQLLFALAHFVRNTVVEGSFFVAGALRSPT